MLYMEQGVEMNTGTSGGIFAGLKRVITGESFFITTFKHGGPGKAHVAFGALRDGKVRLGDDVAVGHVDAVLAVAYSHDGRVIASGGWDGKVWSRHPGTVWD